MGNLISTSRRGFIGSIIGLVSGSPFIAEEITPEIHQFSHGDKLHLFGDLFNKKDLHNFGFYLFGNGEKFKGPQIDRVEIEEKTDQMTATIYAKILIIKIPISYEGLGLTWKGKFVLQRKFASLIPFGKDDELKVYYSLSTAKLLSS